MNHCTGPRNTIIVSTKGEARDKECCNANHFDNTAEQTRFNDLVKKYKDCSGYSNPEHMLSIPMDSNEADLLLFMDYRLRQLGIIELLGFFKIWSDVTGYKTVKDYYRYSPKGAFYSNIMCALKALPDKSMEIMLLHYIEGYTRREVSERLEVSGSCVSAVLKKSLASLRSYKLIWYFFNETENKVTVVNGEVLPVSVNQLKELDIECLDLGRAVLMSLRRKNINTIGELSELTLAEILAFRSLGIATAADLLSRISDMYSRVRMTHKFHTGNLKACGIYCNKEELQRLRSAYCED